VTVLELLPETELDVAVDQRTVLAGGIASAVFDQARVYRYLLTRIWDPARPPMVFVMLNPSTADAFVEDPTSRRCQSFARREGAGGVVVVNLFALRSTNPRALLGHADPVGRHNDAFIRQAINAGGQVVAAWGADRAVGARGGEVARYLGARGVELLCLGRTSGGCPRHPLYVTGTAVLEAYGVAS
jgi:hypothetical protein